MEPDPNRLSPEALLQQAAFLRSLARGLVHGDAEAEDLVQETWLRALERPPARPHALRAWLGRVARRLASNLRRSAERRSRREQWAARPEALPSAEEILAIQERLQRVAAVVRSLPGPALQVIHLRFYQDLGFPEIAARLGEPVETVKARARRALDLLRERLDREQGGDRRAWLLVLAPLAARLEDTPPASAPTAVATKALLAAAVLLLATGTSLLLLTRTGPSLSDPLDAGGLAAAPAAESDPSLARGEPEAPPRQALAPSSPDRTAPAGSWPVLVTEKATGRPVSGAEVLWLDPDRVEDPESYWEEGCFRGVRDPEPTFRKYGRTRSSGLDGMTWVPPLPLACGLMARKGGLWAEACIGHRLPQRLPIRLELEPEKVFRVQVVDAEGRPRAGVPVGLFHRDPSRCPVYEAWTTGPEGLAEMRNFLWVMTRVAGGAVQGIPLIVAPRLPLAFPVTQPVWLKDLPANPVRLILPPCGQVEVFVRGPHGELPDGEARVCLNRLFAPGERRADDPSTGPCDSIPLRGGRALFSNVGLGLALEARAAYRSQAVVLLDYPDAAQGQGPTEPGQRVRFDLVLGPAPPILLGRAVTKAGRPLAGVNLRPLIQNKAEWTDPREWIACSILRTDPAGRFRVRLDPRAWSGPRMELLLETAVPAEKEGDLLEGRVVLEGPLVPGETEIGDVALSPTPPFATGIVVDTRGRPVPGARILIGAAPESSDDSRIFSNSSGAFAVWSRTGTRLPPEVPVPDLLLTAFQQGMYQDRPVEASRGVRGLRLVLAKGASLSGRLLLDSDICPSALMVLLRIDPPGRDGKARDLESTPGEAGRFRFDELAPGTVSVRVQLRDSWLGHAPLFMLENLPIPQGAGVEDPRLQEIDLRGRIHRFEATVVDGEGRPLEEAEIRESGGSGFFGGFKGILRFLAERPAFDAEIRAPGFKIEKVRLEAGRPALVRLARRTE